MKLQDKEVDNTKSSEMDEITNYTTRIKGITGFEKSKRWVQGYVGEEKIVDSKRVLLLWPENHMIPMYCFPKEDVLMSKLNNRQQTESSDQFGETLFLDLEVEGKIVENAAWEYTNPPESWKELKNYIIFKWSAIEKWFEEAEQVYVHARDPYHRVDVTPSTRKIQIKLGGQIIAESERSMFLFETGLPTRYYIPREDVKMDMLETSELKTRCPYKGVASYWSAKVGDQVFKDIVWGYSNPVAECPRIKDLVCFYNEKVEATYVNGVLEPKPETPWS